MDRWNAHCNNKVMPHPTRFLKGLVEVIHGKTKLIVEFGLFDCLEECDSFIPQMKETDFASQNTQGNPLSLKSLASF